MASVSRACAGVENKNRLRAHRIKVYVQRYPGKLGEDKERGVTETPEFKIAIDGVVMQWGNLEEDGSLEALIPGGCAATLEVLGTTYDLKILTSLEPHDSLLGQQRRLNLLGYYDARVDDKWGVRTDVATLDFQADSGLDPDGKLNVAATYDKIKDVFGE